MLWGVVTSASAYSPLELTGTSYTETFDGISSGLPAGWSVKTNASAAYLGSPNVVTTAATAWGSTSGQFANFAGTTHDGIPFTGTESSAIQAAATDRCLGIRQSSSFGDPGAAFVLQLQDTRGFEGFEVSLDFNMLSVQLRSTIWTVDYAVGNSPGTFTALGTYADPGTFGSTNKTFSFGTALDNQSQNVWIRIVALSSSTGTVGRDTFGIDNFRLSYRAVPPEPLNIQLIGTNAVLSWTNPGCILQAAPAIDGLYTNVPGALSPHTNPITSAQKYFRLKPN